MRICMFAMLVPAHVTGGMEIHSLELAKGVAKAGHEVVVMTSRHPEGIEKETIEGVEIRYVDSKNTYRRPLNREAVRLLERLHDEKKFDVIHSQSFAAYYYVKDDIKARLKIPLVTTIHGTSKSSIKSHLNQGLNPMLLPKIVWQIFTHFETRRVVRGSDRIIAISRELTESIPGEYGIKPSKVKTVYNGVDTQAFKPGESRIRKKYPGKNIILSISVLHKQKGIQYLLKAFRKVVAEIPETHLIIVGEGKYKHGLEKLASEIGITDQVTFTGRIPYTKLLDYYNACDVFTIPSTAVEGLPLTELEAMACGRPVVASNTGGIPTVIEDGVNGILTEPGNPADLAENMKKILKDESLAEKIGKKARETIIEGFSKDRMVEDTISVYKEAANT